MSVEQWVKDLTERHFGKCEMAIGKRMRHPDGRMVFIVDGQYWGEFGVSNFWYWREVKADGKLGKTECGYGWR
jgi:hypothetical protein